MDTEQLAAEVLKRVLEKIGPLTIDRTEQVKDKEKKEKILILTTDHQEGCHSILDNQGLKQSFDLECALSKEYDYSSDDFDGVIMYGVDNMMLSKLALGIIDCDYLKLASDAILSGKSVYMIKEEVEFFQYKKTSPAMYYKVFENHLELLRKSGVIICSKEGLGEQLIKSQKGKNSKPEQKRIQPLNETVYEQENDVGSKVIEKKVITEKDMMSLKKDNDRLVKIGLHSIVTDLAREFAEKNKIVIQRVALDKRS
ncbi:MAG TPA: hypothetical protein IAC62_06235 [Candidatus Pelethocola excrementipullorum]|nr:hypothetical protein [Candidatus Pelethocola excrementipullorum]